MACVIIKESESEFIINNSFMIYLNFTRVKSIIICYNNSAINGIGWRLPWLINGSFKWNNEQPVSLGLIKAGSCL